MDLTILWGAGFPTQDYDTITANALTAFAKLRDHYKSMDLAFAPPVSVSWDSSPRTIPSDTYAHWGYPWTPAYVLCPDV